MYGQIEAPRPCPPGPNRKIHMAALESMLAYLKQNPCTYQDELRVFLKEEWGIEVSQTTISKRLKEMNQSRKQVQRIGPQDPELRLIYQAE